MSLFAVPHAVRSLVTDEVAREIAQPYSDQVFFPERVLIDGPDSTDRRFPGWPGRVLVIAAENQGVCAWGAPLDGADDPVVLVGGEIRQRTGWVRGTTQYSSNVAEFVAARRWDASCLSQQPLLQAQAIELEAATFRHLRQQFSQKPQTPGWSGHTVHRFERRGAKVMLWDAPGHATGGYPPATSDYCARLRRLSGISPTCRPRCGQQTGKAVPCSPSSGALVNGHSTFLRSPSRALSWPPKVRVAAGTARWPR